MVVKGVVMNNGMRNFSLDPDALNCLKPGHIPSTPMAPVLVLKNNRPILTGGAPVECTSRFTCSRSFSKCSITG